MLFRAFFLVLFWFVASVAWAQDSSTSYAPADPNALPNVTGYEMVLDAKLTEKGNSIERGMVWRIFRERPDADGKLPLVATAKGGTASVSLPAGTYLVHAAFGRAGATKRIALGSGGAKESFVLQAGGLKLSAESEGQAIPAKDLRFSIYELEQDEEGERKLIALNVAADRVIRLNTGTYHVLSRFGTINATVRADLVVKAGEVTEAVLQHRGANISMRLVSQIGGDPVANTSWAVLTEEGEEVFKSTSVSPSLILAEGTYEASVRNGDRNFRKSFVVEPGKNIRVEVLLN
jgi:hypothetical protein